MPHIIDARAGEQTGDAQKKFSNLTPISASLSRFGVFSSLLPAQPIAHAPWSSERIKRKLGLVLFIINLRNNSKIYAARVNFEITFLIIGIIPTIIGLIFSKTIKTNPAA